MKLLRVLALLFTSCTAMAAEVPAPGKADSRLREIEYKADQVTTIHIIKGVGTRIMLARDEQIKDAAPGFGSDCNNKTDLWCILANVGASDIYVKAKSEAKEPNNLEITTNKRVYTFDFVLNPAFQRDRDAMFRVTFRYPDDIVKAQVETQSKDVLQAKLEEENKPKNWNYTMQALPGADIIAPSRVYDDGNFMYLYFPNNRRMPEVFIVEADGSEKLPSTNVDKETIVVHRIYKRLMLRLDKHAVGIWNEAYDPDGTAIVDGTTVKGLKRVFKGQAE